MRGGWGDLNARARGLGTRLLRPTQLESLAGCATLDALAEGLRHAGLLIPETPAITLRGLDLAVRRMAAARLRTLARWAGRRTAVLAIAFEDEERRSLRAILRGAVQGASGEARLSGLIPTPGLPERALKELAGQRTVPTIVSLLTAWRHPYGPVLAAEARAGEPDLFRLEGALNRAFAARALTGARTSRDLLAYVRDTIDLENVGTVLALASHGKDVIPKEVFLPGGERVPIEKFETALAAGVAGRAGERLADAFAGTPLAPVLRRHAGDPVVLERGVLGVRIRSLRQQSQLRPLGPAPLLWYLLRLRAQVQDLRQIIWGLGLGAPHAGVTAALVTA